MKEKRSLVVGGTSGLGLALARLLHSQGYRVAITGKHDPLEEGLEYIPFFISEATHDLLNDVHRIIEQAGPIDLLAYVAGYLKKGSLSMLDGADVLTTLSVGLIAPALVVQEVLHRQGRLSSFIAITSTSQWIPRVHESIYAAAKAGLGMLANSLSLDPVIQKTLVVGPAGMQTAMQTGRKDINELLDPIFVARETLRLFEGEFTYRLVRMLRNPERIEIVEERL